MRVISQRIRTQHGRRRPKGLAHQRSQPRRLPGERRRRRLGFWLGVARAPCGARAARRRRDLPVRAARRRPGARASPGAGVPIDRGRHAGRGRRPRDHRRAREAGRGAQGGGGQKEEESLKAPGQVVDLPTPREEKRPDDAKFVSEHDSSVEHETKKYGRFEDNARQGDHERHGVGVAAGDARGRRAAGDAHARSRQASCAAPPASPASRRRARGSRERATAPPNPGHLDQGGVDLRSSARRRGRGKGGGGARGGSGLSLMPSEQQLARAIGGGTQDAPADVEDGDETALNSKRWRFASFFNRVKRQVAEHWHPEEVYRQRDPTGAVYGHTEPLHRAAHPAQARRAAEQRGARTSRAGSISSTTRRSRRSSRRSRSPTRRASSSRTGLINFGFGFLFDLNGPPEMRWFKY